MSTTVTFTGILPPRPPAKKGGKPRPRRRPVIRFELLGDDVPSGGLGGWEYADQEATTKRRGRRIMVWRGSAGWALDLPLMLNGMDVSPGRHTSVEARCRALMAWGRPNKITRKPIIFTVSGPVRTPPRVRWVIDSIDWGPQVRLKGVRVQQQVVVHLVEHQSTRITSPAKKAAKKGKKKDRGKKRRT